MWQSIGNTTLYTVILAGGLGKRLFPVSIPSKPKQFLDLIGTGRSLLQDTASRALELCNPENVITVGNVAHQFLLYSQLQSVAYEISKNLILEYKAMNTAFSVMKALEIIQDGIIIILPSDHYISGNFEADIRKGVEEARKDQIITFGIQPTYAETGYGYLLGNNFIEKPDLQTAQALIEQGALWNSGIFVFDAALMRAEFIRHQYNPEQQISFDKAIMEKTDKMKVVPANFEWSDLGSFEALRKLSCHQKLLASISAGEYREAI